MKFKSIMLKWKKLDARDHMLNNSIYTKCPKKRKSIETESTLVTAGEKGLLGITIKGRWDAIWVIRMCLNWYKVTTAA